MSESTSPCANCGAQSTSLKDCAGCALVSYCSRECQRADWTDGGHRTTCKIAQHFPPDSETLNLDNMGDDDDVPSELLDVNSVLSYAVDHLSKLKHFSIWIPQQHVLHDPMLSTAPGFKLGVNSFRSFLQDCPNLSSFHFGIGDCCEKQTRRMTDNGAIFSELGGRHRETLQDLRLTCAVFQSVSTLASILSSTQNLRVLKLDHMTLGRRDGWEWENSAPEALVSVVSTLTNLVTLSFDDCYFHDDNLEGLLSTLTELRYLTLTGCFGDNRPGGYLTDRGFETIARLCPNLQSLDLNYYKKATKNGVEAILRSCRHLRELQVSYAKIPSGDLPRLLQQSDTLLLFSYGTPLCPLPRPDIRKAVIETGGRTLIMSDFEGLIEFSDLSDHIQAEAARSKELVEQASENANKPGVFNEWESHFEG